LGTPGVDIRSAVECACSRRSRLRLDLLVGAGGRTASVAQG
jgi:hypothetical protein